MSIDMCGSDAASAWPVADVCKSEAEADARARGLDDRQGAA
eukprot:CAMPEP_0117562196 /NCGR_PEP_ID=MMETSP0784-20121206/54827_1 /TAXON_ID=39447 /ORGANISM="" /LENGTH=40 /DNA_ID= /DNA_START= /DNA_END= /DNA_ORIENTATION=